MIVTSESSKRGKDTLDSHTPESNNRGIDSNKVENSTEGETEKCQNRDGHTPSKKTDKSAGEEEGVNTRAGGQKGQGKGGKPIRHSSPEGAGLWTDQFLGGVEGVDFFIGTEKVYAMKNEEDRAAVNRERENKRAASERAAKRRQDTRENSQETKQENASKEQNKRHEDGIGENQAEDRETRTGTKRATN